MAVYHGFFDAAIDVSTGEYDRKYGAEDFTQYFERIVGTGVCVYENPDSLKAFYDSSGQKVMVNPGYAFIRGYWLKNDGLFAIDMRDAAVGDYVILAKLSLSRRVFEIVRENKPTEENYSDELVLAYVTVGENSSVTVTDNRGETYCPTIDALGSISEKVKWAINYIENEIEAKLDEILSNLEEKSAEIDGKVEEANELISQLSPPAVGTIQFSASQNVGDEWLRCDGSFINEVDYPELVAALGKTYPSGDKFKLLNTTGMKGALSNGVLYGGKLWVYSYKASKLYGVSLDGTEPPKEISVTSSSPKWSNLVSPSIKMPICLSIVDSKTGTGAKVFLSQVLHEQDDSQNVSDDYKWADYFCLFVGDFNPESSTTTVDLPFVRVSGDTDYWAKSYVIPYVISALIDGKESYYTYWGEKRYLKWDKDAEEAEGVRDNALAYSEYSRTGFNKKNQDELVALRNRAYGNTFSSLLKGIYNTDQLTMDAYNEASSANTLPPLNPMIVVGAKRILNGFDLTKTVWFDLDALTSHVDENPFPHLPSGSRVFVDAGTYAFNKDMFFVFVGTGIVFSRSLEAKNFGFLDTTDVLGVITQNGYLEYDEEANTLVLIGEDSSSTIKAAKIQLNTLYDYATDGAWLPMIASDGVPAYIKAVSESS